MAQRTQTQSAPAGQRSREMQGYFYTLADHLTSKLQGAEVFTAGFAAEESDFARLNKSQVRQAGAVTQYSLGVDLIDGARHVGGETTLTGGPAEDRQRLRALVTTLRERLPHLPEDPHLLYARDVHSTEQHGQNRLPDAGDTIASVLDRVKAYDFVGIWASGGIYSGFANSLGQRNWFSTYTFHLDWSLYHQADKAVKTAYAGFAWDPTGFDAKLQSAVEQLKILAQPARTIDPGRYRVFLAPVALSEILGTLSWGGFGLKDHRTKQSTLLRMSEEKATLSPAVSIFENTKDGVAPNFQGAGFLKPDRVVLIEKGTFRDCLISPRSAKEYAVSTNGASDGETPESVEMAAGDLAQGDVLARLDRGVYINNLWYLNYSDRPNCRMTGMTRFACFWVENGRIVAPLNVMRFDETVFRALGSNLLGLTAEREMILDSNTYYRRSTGSARLPGALVEDFSFTL